MSLFHIFAKLVAKTSATLRSVVTESGKPHGESMRVHSEVVHPQQLHVGAADSEIPTSAQGALDHA
jgi:hypothetical protein